MAHGCGNVDVLADDEPNVVIVCWLLDYDVSASHSNVLLV